MEVAIVSSTMALDTGMISKVFFLKKHLFKHNNKKRTFEAFSFQWDCSQRLMSAALE